MTLSLESIDSMVYDERKKADLITERRRVSSEERKHAVAYEKSLATCSQTSGRWFYSYAQVDRCRQPYDDAGAKSSLDQAPESER